MTQRRSPFRIGLAILVDLAAYAFALALFAAGATFGFLMFGTIPFWFAIPPLLSGTHELARSLVRPLPRQTLAAERQSAPSREVAALDATERLLTVELARRDAGLAS